MGKATGSSTPPPWWIQFAVRRDVKSTKWPGVVFFWWCTTSAFTMPTGIQRRKKEKVTLSLSFTFYVSLTFSLPSAHALSLSRFLNLWLVSRSLLGSFLMFLLFLLPVCLSVRLPGFRHNWIGTSSVRKESGSLIARTVGKCGIILTPGATFTKIHLLRYLRMGPIS